MNALLNCCRAHAADVLHTVHAILFKGDLVKSSFVSLSEALIICIAAVVHDVEHPGRPSCYALILSKNLASPCKRLCMHACMLFDVN